MSPLFQCRFEPYRSGGARRGKSFSADRSHQPSRITPTIVLFLVFTISGLLGSNFDQMLVLKSNIVDSTNAEVLDTYIYDIALGNTRTFAGQSMATAAGLLRSLIALALLLLSDRVSRKLTGSGIY